MSFTIHEKFKLNGKSFSNNDELISFSETISSETTFFLKHLLNDESSLNLTTSGSTGVPKVIKVKKEFMKNSAIATCSFFNLKENTTALLCMNPSYVGGKMMLVRALVLGWHLDVVPPSSNPLKTIKKTYDFCAMVPLQVFHSITNLNKVNILIIGGGAISNKLLEMLQNVKTTCFATYGMTETISHIAVKKLNDFGLNERVYAAHYKTLSGISISQDARNCLLINAPKISDTQIITNDIVELISNTEFKWLGRYDNVINSGGIKLIPEQIENKLASSIDKRFFVSSIPDKVLGEKMILIIEGDLDTNLILNTVKNLKSLNKYEVPKEVCVVPKFVETETKKIQRKKTLDLIKFIKE